MTRRRDLLSGASGTLLGVRRYVALDLETVPDEELVAASDADPSRPYADKLGRLLAARRAPYMHDGSSPDLTDALFDYIHVLDNPWLDPAMDEVRIFPFDVPALLAFLESLDGTGYEDSAPATFPQ